MSDEQFPPTPGGMVDTARKQAAAVADLPVTVDNTDGPVDYSAVRVRSEPPDLGNARGLTLSSANPVLRLLGADRQRRTAVIIAVDADVYITSSKDAALAVAGNAAATGAFYLPAGIGIPLDNQAEYWVAATTVAAVTRVSILIGKDSTL